MLGSKKERFEVLLEDIKSEVHVVLERVDDLAKLEPKVDTLTKDMEIVKDDVAAIKAGQATLQKDVIKLQEDVVKLKTGQAVLQDSVDEIKSDLKQKANTEEVATLKKRVEHFEHLHA